MHVRAARGSNNDRTVYTVLRLRLRFRLRLRLLLLPLLFLPLLPVTLLRSKTRILRRRGCCQ